MNLWLLSVLMFPIGCLTGCGLVLRKATAVHGALLACYAINGGIGAISAVLLACVVYGVESIELISVIAVLGAAIANQWVNAWYMFCVLWQTKEGRERLNEAMVWAAKIIGGIGLGFGVMHWLFRPRE